MKDLEPTRCSTCFERAVQDGRCRACQAEQAEANRDRRALPLFTEVAAKYVVGKVLGSGGFGITYLAQDLQLGRRVALKELFPVGLVTRAPDGVGLVCNSVDDEVAYRRGLTRFFREGQILAKFNHPNIVRVHEVFQANGSAYLAMEFLDGMTLKSWIRAAGRLDVPKALQVMGFVFDALKAVHAAKVVHRDLKPDNIYITQTGRTLLLDFGGAKQLTAEGDKSMDAMFAQGYAAPEQYFANSGKVGPWTDIYACGATLYKMLTGRTMEGALDRYSEDIALQWDPAVVPPPVRRAIARAVSLKHGDRYQTVQAFEVALAGDDAPPEFEPVPPDWLRRRWLAAGAAGAVASIAAMLFWRSRSDLAKTDQVGRESADPAASSVAGAASANLRHNAPVPNTVQHEPSARELDAWLNAMIAGAAAQDWQQVETAAVAIRDPRRAMAWPAGEAASRPWLAGVERAIEEGDYRGAAALLVPATARTPEDWRAWSALGYAWLRLKDPIKAKEALRNGLRIWPYDAGAWAHLAELLAVEKRTAPAAAALRLAVYFSSRRARTLAFLRAEGNLIQPEFKSVIRAEGVRLDQLPQRGP